MIHVVVNLLRFMVSSEHSAKHSHPPHPGYLLRHPSTGSALPLTYVHRPALPVGQGAFLASSSRVDSHRPSDDQPIVDQLPKLLMRVGLDDFISLFGVQSDFLFATEQNTGGKPLPKSEHAYRSYCRGKCL